MSSARTLLMLFFFFLGGGLHYFDSTRMKEKVEVGLQLCCNSGKINRKAIILPKIATDFTHLLSSRTGDRVASGDVVKTLWVSVRLVKRRVISGEVLAGTEVPREGWGAVGV